MRVASLFSGIGGIDLGFKQAGFDIVWANELDEATAKSYYHNHSSTQLIVGDIKKIEADSIPNFDVLTAGFPCQSFSIVGKQRGFDDPRGNLFFEISRILDNKRPLVVFLENVANLVEHDHGKTFLVIYNTLVQFGYFVKYKVMNVKDYADIPQQRNRIYIVAFLDYDICQRFVFPKETKLTKKINDIIDRGQKHHDSYYYNSSSIHYESLLRIVTDKKAIYKIEDAGVNQRRHYICPTLTANMGTFSDRVPIILDDCGIRKLTPYECLALQGFPKEFKFAPNTPMGVAYKAIGNTVCVPTVRKIAEQILKAIRESDNANKSK